MKFVDGKSSIREKESIISMKILIYSVTKRLSDKLNIISDVTPVLVCLDGIQLNWSYRSFINYQNSWVFLYLNWCRNYIVSFLIAKSWYLYCTVRWSLSTNEMWPVTESYHLAVVPCSDLHGINGSYFDFMELMRCVVKSLQYNESSKLTEKQPGKGSGTQHPKWSMWHKGNLYEIFICINNWPEEPDL